MGHASDVDPLTQALAPPPDETDEQRAERLQKEERARRVSDEIDEQIRQERAALKKQKRPIKVLLLGQSESGECPSGLISGPAQGPPRAGAGCVLGPACRVPRPQSPPRRYTSIGSADTFLFPRSFIEPRLMFYLQVNRLL